MNIDSVFSKMIQIETKNLILREISKDDINSIYDIFSDSEVMKYYDLYPHRSVEESKELIRKFQEGFKNKYMLRWGITLKHSNNLIGTCGFHNISENNCKAEIGYDLSRVNWNRNIMSEAIEALVHFGFEKLNLNRIEAFVEKKNIASQKLLVKCGFKQEGLLREYENCKDRFIDLLIYGIIQKDIAKK